MSYATKCLCVIEFNEHTTFAGMYRRMLNAVEEGIICFQFRLKIRNPRTSKVDEYEERWAYNPADPIDALHELAREMFDAFTETVARTLAKQM